jgi:hypothetical protein
MGGRRLAATLRALAGAGLCLWFATSCATMGGNSGPPPQRGEPQLSSCVTKKIEKYSNCGEYCASLNLGCQNYGCKHSSDTSKSWGGMSFGNDLCTGTPVRSYQCNDPFVSDTAVECCCVGL